MTEPAEPASTEPVSTESASTESIPVEPAPVEPVPVESMRAEPMGYEFFDPAIAQMAHDLMHEPLVSEEGASEEGVSEEAIAPRPIAPQPIAPKKVGKVYLVGSGPGNIDNLTVQAHRLLTQAEVVVYDALIDGNLLAVVPATCRRINVGKRGGEPSMRQSEINDLLVELCQARHQVVRLKSGDPFIFGRCQSEMTALAEAGCVFEVVPGLSSALAAPLFAGIPLTDPVWSRCFTVFSAHEPNALDWQTLSQLDTLVILMGGKTLPAIIDNLRQWGKSPKTPIAIIRWAGQPQEQIWQGTLGNILKQTAGERLSPCIIVIGEVVQLRQHLQSPPPPVDRPENVPAEIPAPSVFLGSYQGSTSFAPELSKQALPQQSPELSMSADMQADMQADVQNDVQADVQNDVQSEAQNDVQTSAQTSAVAEQTIAGKTILVTRAASQSSQFSDRLQGLNATVIDMPALEIVPPASWRQLDDAIARLAEFDWLILTSSNAVDYFFERLEVQDQELPDRLRIAVVGDKTARALADYGLQPDFVPPAFVADSLAEHFPGNLDGALVLFPRVESGGRDLLVKDLWSKGAEVEEVAAYQSRCPEAIAPAALAALQSQRVDIITFASSKTVKHFCQMLERAHPNAAWQAWLEGVCIASIGPQTSRTCQDFLGRVDAEAQEYTLDGLIVAIAQWLNR